MAIHLLAALILAADPQPATPPKDQLQKLAVERMVADYKELANGSAGPAGARKTVLERAEKSLPPIREYKSGRFGSVNTIGGTVVRVTGERTATIRILVPGEVGATQQFFVSGVDTKDLSDGGPADDLGGFYYCPGNLTRDGRTLMHLVRVDLSKDDLAAVRKAFLAAIGKGK